MSAPSLLLLPAAPSFGYTPEIEVPEKLPVLSGSSQTSVSQVYGINGRGAFCGLIGVPAQKRKPYVERPFARRFS